LKREAPKGTGIQKNLSLEHYKLFHPLVNPPVEKFLDKTSAGVKLNKVGKVVNVEK
jgi:hypothetical protein